MVSMSAGRERRGGGEADGKRELIDAKCEVAVQAEVMRKRRESQWHARRVILRCWRVRERRRRVILSRGRGGCGREEAGGGRTRVVDSRANIIKRATACDDIDSRGLTSNERGESISSYGAPALTILAKAKRNTQKIE